MQYAQMTPIGTRVWKWRSSLSIDVSSVKRFPMGASAVDVALLLYLGLRLFTALGHGTCLWKLFISLRPDAQGKPSMGWIYNIKPWTGLSFNWSC